MDLPGMQTNQAKAPWLALLAALALSATPAPVQAQSQTVEYYHLDAVGNVRAVSDEAGQVIERHDYLPFGEEWCGTAVCSQTTAGQPYRFTGKERDPETGLDYFGARYYGSGIGRFTSIDPVYTWQENLVDPQRWNRYTYGRSNPLRYIDPDGKFIVSVLVVGGAVLYALLASPDIANAPGPSDATLKSDQSGKLIANTAIGVVIMKGLLGAEMARPPDQMGPPEEPPQVAGPGSAKNARKRIRGLERQVEEHERKLADYRANPDAFDNRGFLKNAPNEAARQRIIDSRVRSLEKQIGTFKRDIEALRTGGSSGN